MVPRVSYEMEVFLFKKKTPGKIIQGNPMNY